MGDHEILRSDQAPRIDRDWILFASRTQSLKLLASNSLQLISPYQLRLFPISFFERYCAYKASEGNFSSG